MGLIEKIQSGSQFYRDSTVLSLGTGYTTEFGASYILLGISVDAPCRVRLYANSSSLVIDAPRPSSSFDYSASVALNLDAGLTSDKLSLTFNPPIIATTTVSTRTYYNIESPTAVNATISYYPIEESPTDRPVLTIPNDSGVTLGAFQTSSGNFTTYVVSGNTFNVPKSFLIIGAQCNLANIRLRVYSKPIEEISVTEKNRPFSTQPADDANLIGDMIFDAPLFYYPISPVLQAFNLENYIDANNRIGYIIENLLGSTQSSVKPLLQIYSLED